MRTAIDKAGRIVIPKRIRDRLGLKGGEELELDESGGVVELRRPHPSDELVEINGVLTFEHPRGPKTLDETLDAIDEARRLRS